MPHRWMLRKVHVSWHVASYSIGIVVGVAFVGRIESSLYGIEWALISILGVCFVSIVRARYLLVLAFICGGILGVWRGGGEQIALAAYEQLINSNVTIYGAVGEDPSYGTKSDQRFKLTKVSIGEEKLPGVIWISTDKNVVLKRGDVVRLSGRLSEGFGNIPASMYQAKIDSVQRPIPGDIGRRARDWFGGGVKNSMPDEEAQLALAFLVGQKLTVSDSLSDQLRTVGLIHAVVASGYHLTILVGVVRRLMERLSKYLTFVLSAGMIGGFIMITGFSPSMTRAGLVTSLGLIAWYYGRLIHPLVLLPFAAAVTVMYQPEYIWGDVGWYLSFAAFTGVLLLAPLINEYFWGPDKRPGVLREVLIATVAAQIVTLPISIHVFGYYSAYALLANILVVPLIPLTMLMTFISGIIGLTFVSIAQMVGLPVVWILHYMIAVVGWIASLPASKTEVTINILGLVIGYIFICLLVIFLWIQTKHDFRGKSDGQKLF